jgi:hypothetical protein
MDDLVFTLKLVAAFALQFLLMRIFGFWPVALILAGIGVVFLTAKLARVIKARL